MTRRVLHILCLALLLLPGKGFSQALPTLERDKGITVETLPDGVSCYLVPGSSRKGFADFALVQKGTPDVAASRLALAVSDRPGAVIPYKFVSSHGSTCTRQGFISYLPSSTRFDFPDMPVYDQAVTDSTLMMLFDIASSSKGEQALIACGDFSASELLERIKLYSILLTSREKTPDTPDPAWEQKDTLDLRFLVTGSDEVAGIRLTFSSGRTERENMNTPLPLLTAMYSSELAVILEGRLAREFSAAGVPLVGLGFRRTDSSSWPWEEKSALSVRVPLKDMEKALSLIAGVLSSLDSDGATLAEFNYARAVALGRLKEKASEAGSNSANVDRCVSAYLYGSSLASGQTIYSTVSRKSLSEERELQLFNGFVSALLDPSRNLFIRCDVPGTVDTSHLADVFKAGWSAKKGLLSIEDAPMLPDFAAKTKIKLKSNSDEPITGGKLWTFSNGMRVIYKQVDGATDFDFALMLNGGYTQISPLARGEGVFVGDLLKLSRVAGCSWADFEASLATEGVLLNSSVGATDIRITGKASSGKLGLVFSALSAICNQREADADAFKKYRASQAYGRSVEKLGPRNVFSLMDSLACPQDPYPERRQAVMPGSDLQGRAEACFARQFSKCSDGILVIMGDFDSENLQKDLCRYLTGFKTSGAHSTRPVTDYPLLSGRRSYGAEPAGGGTGGLEIGSYMELSCLEDLNMQKYMTFRLAESVFRSRLAPVLADCGYSARVESEAKFFPKERMVFRVAAVPCFEDGLALGVSPVKASEMQLRLRDFTRELPSTKIPASELKALKASLLQEMKSVRDNPSELMEAVLLRYSIGRNMYSDYEKAVNAVTEAGVKEFFSSLCGGSIVEYVIE